MNNRDTLIDLMVDNKLERRDVAELLRVERDTVDRWLLPHAAHGNEAVPDMAVELLTLKLQMRRQAQQTQQ